MVKNISKTDIVRKRILLNLSLIKEKNLSLANDKDNLSPKNRKKKDMFPLPKSKELLYSDNKQAKCDFTSAVYVKYHVSFLHFTNKI